MGKKDKSGKGDKGKGGKTVTIEGTGSVFLAGGTITTSNGTVIDNKVEGGVVQYTDGDLTITCD